MKIWIILRILILIILPISVLFYTISSNIYIYSQSIIKVETITFPSRNGDIVSANLYYPKKPFSMPCPVIIYLHGLSWSKDLDARFPLELTKKGFMVLQLDQEGHGETSRGIYERETLGPLFWENVIGALDYIYLRKNIFNISAIGCFGHSLGGWATLMASVIDPRINASISLAGPSNLTYFSTRHDFDRQFHLMKIPFNEDILHNPELRRNLSAVLYLNGTFPGIIPQNLLLIYGGADTLVPAQQGVDINKTINNSKKCQLEILPGADHSLMNTDLFYTNIRVVQYFEEKLMGISPEPRSILEKEIVWVQVFMNQIVTLLLIQYLIAIFAFFIYRNIKSSKMPNSDQKLKNQEFTKNRIEKLKTLGRLTLYITMVLIPVFGIWVVLYFLLPIINNFILTMIIGGLLFIIYAIGVLWYKNREKVNIDFIKRNIKKELDIKSITLGVIFGILLTVIYFVISNAFKIIFIYPRSYYYYIESLLLAIPIFGIELIFRKIIQEELMKHNKHKKFFSNLLIRWTTGFIYIGVLFPMLQITKDYYIPTTIGAIFLTGISLTSIYLYEKSRTIIEGILFETIFIAYIFANSYYLFF